MVGKSSITYRFINYQTPTEHDATLEDKYKVLQEIGGVSHEIGKSFNKLLRNHGHSRTRRLPGHA